MVDGEVGEVGGRPNLYQGQAGCVGWLGRWRSREDCGGGDEAMTLAACRR